MSGGVHINASGDVTIVGDVVGRDKIVIHNPAPVPAREAETRRGLRLLREAVRAFWIDGVLSQAVRQAPLALGQQLHPEAVDHPWGAVLETPDTAQRAISPDTRPGELFEKHGRALLILGEPGCGKTITLLQLARDLLASAEQDAEYGQPIPVLFHLSSWSAAQPLADWLADELALKYRVPRRLGRLWLQGHRLLPLLDGLDEVSPALREPCVRTINAFAASTGLAGLAVCSRLQPYMALSTRLQLSAAIVLQPLTAAQIDSYLERGGEALAGLRAALGRDPGLRELAQSPLMLNVMSLAYAGLGAETIAPTDTAELRRRLLERYVDRMLAGPAAARFAYTPGQMRRWLSWLAWRMSAHGHTLFQIEQIQPGWLSGRAARLAYVMATRLLAGALVGGLGLLAASLIFTDGLTTEGRDPLIAAGLLLVTCLVIGLGVAATDGALIETRRTPPTASRARTGLHVLGFGLLGGLPAALCGLGLGLMRRSAFLESTGLPSDTQFMARALASLAIAIGFGLAGAATVGLLFGPRSARLSRAGDVRAGEGLAWSWRRALSGAALGLAAGLAGSVAAAGVASLAAYLATVLTRGPTSLAAILLAAPGALLSSFLLMALAFMPLFSTAGAVAGWLFSGLYRRALGAETASSAGLRLLARNTLVAALGLGLAGLLPLGVGDLFDRVYFATIVTAAFAGAPPAEALSQMSGELWRQLLTGRFLVTGLTYALPIGLLGALWYGGLDLLQHSALRASVWLAGDGPWRVGRFLDQAADRGLLRKAGSGYLFLHRLLLEHFAGLAASPRAGELEPR